MFIAESFPRTPNIGVVAAKIPSARRNEKIEKPKVLGVKVLKVIDLTSIIFAEQIERAFRTSKGMWRIIIRVPKNEASSIATFKRLLSIYIR
jgi:hypothetical protein